MEAWKQQRLFRTPLYRPFLLFICLAAFTATAVLSDRIFEHVPHSEDEVAYLFQARVFAQNRLAAPTPALAQAFWSPFVVDYQGLRFGKYPPGWPLLLSLGVRLQAPWLVNATLAALTLALIGWLGSRLYGPGVGLAAAGLGLVTPGFLFLSGSLLSHPASLFWTSLALVALFHLVSGRAAPSPETGRRDRAGYALLAGLALGATCLTRPFDAVGIGLAVGMFLAVLTVRGEVRWAAWPWLLLGGLLVAGLLPLYWWAVTGDPAFNPYLLVWPYDRIGFGPDIGAYGYSPPTALLNTRLKLGALATGLFGWPGWSNLLFLAIPFLAGRARRWDWLLLGTLLGLVGVHVFYWAFGGVDGGFPRYYYNALPALLLLTARGLQISAAYLARWRFSLAGKRVSLAYLSLALVALFIIYNFGWNLPPLLAAQKGKYNITPAPLAVVARAHLTGPALILVQNVTRWNDFAAPFAANSPTLDGPVVYAIDWGPTYNQALRRQFKDRTCWQLAGETLRPCQPER